MTASNGRSGQVPLDTLSDYSTIVSSVGLFSALGIKVVCSLISAAIVFCKPYYDISTIHTEFWM